MNWTKKGLIFNPKEYDLNWCLSHAQLPVADLISSKIIRVYFAGRNEKSYSSIGYVDLDFSEEFRVVKVSKTPVLCPGPIGFFDQHGVFPSSIVTVGDKKYMYYIGWNQGATPPLFYASIGIAISEDNGNTYRKFSDAPILSRSKFDPCLVTSPHVFIENNVWHMTYVSGERWEMVNGVLKSYYNIKYAHSPDGINWTREGTICIDFKDEKESNIARSAVVKTGEIYRMWYCYVYDDQKYRMGYAESLDFKNWKRKDDEAGLKLGKVGDFDSEMTCYPNLFSVNNSLFMLYNGNQYGKEGFGIAALT